MVRVHFLILEMLYKLSAYHDKEEADIFLPKKGADSLKRLSRWLPLGLEPFLPHKLLRASEQA